MRKTKIVCTLGPASNTYDTIKALALAGMNVARFNFSHGTQDSHLETFRIVSRVRNELHLPISTLLDTRGPEIRLKTFENGPITLNIGDPFTLTTRDVPGDQGIVSITYDGLPHDLQDHTRILIDDGLVELQVESKTDTDIMTRVVSGGQISSRKGVNVPGVRFSMLKLITRPPLAFGYRYFYKKGFLDGPEGLFMALVWSAYVFITFCKLWRLQASLDADRAAAPCETDVL